ncbi:MAG: DUF4255 domain-containing protein [Myxococcales bacterium]|nr:DUF4255 domain-containing protein [Myxococcales bacterium]MCA9560995.1 DUF4255 domain-containing protein [Myxococcales bacterium]MCB9523806.1 DUF4255 domain-containing protein [Myxococcales bacterium]
MQHRIIRQTTESLADTLEDGVRDIVGRTIQVVTGPPLREKFTRTPALGLYMYRVGVRPRRREEQPSLVCQITREGSIREFYRDPPMLVNLDYLVSAWADEEPEQQELLGAAMRVLLEYPVLEGDKLDGDAFDPEERIPVRPVEELSAEFLMSLWRGFGEHLRPAVGYTCRLRIESPRRGPDLRRVDVRSLDIDPNWTGR